LRDLPPINVYIRADGRAVLAGTITQMGLNEEITLPDTVIVRR